MDYSFIKDLTYAKEILGCNAEVFSNILGVSRATYNRWVKDNYVPGDKTLEQVYSAIYAQGINLNGIYEELYLSEEDTDSRILMHGSKNGLRGFPSVQFSEEKKDFGVGFYAGESVKQAISFVSGYKNSCVYFLKLKNCSKLKILSYDVSKEWMILVAYFRHKISEYSNSAFLQKALAKIQEADLIIAPIADNTMYSIINEFVEGGITDEQCFHCLSANRLGKQYVFLNDSVMKNNLQVLRRAYLCNDEKSNFENQKLAENKIGKSKVILAKRQYAGVGKYIEELLCE